MRATSVKSGLPKTGSGTLFVKDFAALLSVLFWTGGGFQDRMSEPTFMLPHARINDDHSFIRPNLGGEPGSLHAWLPFNGLRTVLPVGGHGSDLLLLFALFALFHLFARRFLALHALAARHE